MVVESMIKGRLKGGEKMLAKQGAISTTGLFITYRSETPLAPIDFNVVSAKPDSEASILANKIVVYSDELISEPDKSESSK